MPKTATPIMSDNYSPRDLSAFKAAQAKCEQELVSDVIDTPEALVAVLGVISSLMLVGSSEPQLYLTTQSREGKMSLLSVFILDMDDAFHIDVQTLGQAAFSTPGPSGKKTLKMILESNRVTKVFSDVQSDSEALFRQFGILLGATWDLHLLKHAKDYFHPATQEVRTLNTSLASEIDGTGDWDHKLSMCEEKTKAAQQLMDPNVGGSEDMWEKRPLPRVAVTYSRICVALMPHMFLWSYDSLGPKWHDKAQAESSARIAGTQAADDESSEGTDDGEAAEDA